jgi:heat shock protein HtpX
MNDMNGMKTAVLLAALAALLMFIGGIFGGQGGVVVAFVVAVAINAASYWFSDRIVLRMHRAAEVGEDHVLYRVTRRLAQKAGLPMPKVYVIPTPSPNAFATGRDPRHAAVAATEGLLGMLSETELEGVIAHELAHVKHRDILIGSVAATIAAAIMMLARMAQFAAIFGGGRDDNRGQNPIALLAMIILAPLAAMFIQAAISRNREFAADRGGADIVGSPMGLASALRKIEAGVRQVPLAVSPATAHMYIMKPFAARGLMGLFSTHPPTEARIEALMRGRV